VIQLEVDMSEVTGHWMSRPEMAHALGIAERTVTRMVDADKMVRRVTPNGNLYMLLGEYEGGESAPSDGGGNWLPIKTVAKKQGIAERTAWTWLKVGKIEKNETPDGTLYRVSNKSDDSQREIVDRLDMLESAYADLMLAHAELLLMVEGLSFAKESDINSLFECPF
jgi:hypothetical protein